MYVSKTVTEVATTVIREQHLLARKSRCAILGTWEVHGSCIIVWVLNLVSHPKRRT